MTAPLDEHSDHPVALLGRAARTLLPPSAWGYLMGAAGDGRCCTENESALGAIRLYPRVCRDVSAIDTAVELWGRTVAHPLVVAPSAMHTLFHPQGEHATAAGAARSGTPFVVSMEAGTRWEELSAPDLWCQISPQRDPGATKDLVARAEAAGARAIVLTLDTPVPGARHSQRRAMPEIPGHVRRPNLPESSDDRAAGRFTHPGFTWEDVEAITSATDLPVIGKGILRPDDARLAVDAGVAGIAVSNHGGRNLDAAPATIRCLPGVVEAVDDTVPVLVDGGFRRGSDVLAALALGARAVLIGRPVLWGLAARGADGVDEVLTCLLDELRDAMALCGVTSIAGADTSIVVPA